MHSTTQQLTQQISNPFQEQPNKMRNQENSCEFKKRFLTQPSPSTRDTSNNHPSTKKEKIYSKFSRKQEGRLLQRKKEEPIKMSQQRICFISPEKSFLSSQGDGYLSTGIVPSASMMTFNISSQKDVSFCMGEEIDHNQYLKLNDSVLSLFEELTSERQRKADTKIRISQLQIDNLTHKIEQLSKENAYLRQKTEQIQFIQQFLMQRENYICLLTTNNRQTNQLLYQKEKQNKQLLEQLLQTKQTFEKERKQFGQYLIQCQNKENSQRQEIDWVVKMNIALNQQLNRLRENTDSTQIKENNANKDKPLTFQTNKIKYGKTLQRFPFNTPNLTIIKHQISLKQLIPQTISEQNSRKSFSPIQLQACECQHTVKQLQQINRYNQITIDILKRSKNESDKISCENEKLKLRNRKLQNQVHLLTQMNKKSKSPDSSLELSLSPKRS